MSPVIYEAVLMSAPDFGGNSNPMKEGHSCCGGCCDVRRATVIVNMILIVMSVIGMATFGSLAGSDILEDDDVKHALHEGITFFMVGGGFSILAASLSIAGAVTYNKYLVAVNAVFLALSMFNFGLISFVLNGCFVYPHAFLIYYIHNGIMSEDNYENEQQSCCCIAV